jgi:phosphomannomutase
MTELSATTSEVIDRWIDADPDPLTPNHIEALRSDSESFDRAFGQPLRFGTAGLRGKMGPGPGSMNRLVMRVAAKAIANQLVADGLAQKGIVIGYDARIQSDLYALDAARIFQSMNIECLLVDGPIPTPVLARLVTSRAAGAGLMVTASHNPRSDNGCKLYWSDGLQIRPPLDQKIQRLMDFRNLPRSNELAIPELVKKIEARVAISEYLGGVIERRTLSPEPLEFVYTPLCGVGAETFELAFAVAGLMPPIIVPSQREPDGTFPSLPFPNPEEPGTLDEAFITANHHNLDLILANDPDADRLGVAIRDKNKWRQLTGDEIGLLLCDFRSSETSGANRITASSIVSSDAVAALCKTRDIEHKRTLTGFKWIMLPVIEEPNKQWIFGYEEALGYSVNDLVLDKDGIAAAIEFVRMVTRLKATGSGLIQRMDELALEIGVFESTQVNIRLQTDESESQMITLRSNLPESIGSETVTFLDDYLSHQGLGKSDLLVFSTDLGSRICIRPSGTEPKIKIYIEVKDLNVSTTRDLAKTRHQCKKRLTAIANDISSWFS